jgi:hypothetical protein
MNERIQELSGQASEYAAANATGDWEVGPDYQDIFNKKFAELIVQECAKSIENTIQTDCMSFFPAQACALAKLNMLDHFGVDSI